MKKEKMSGMKAFGTIVPVLLIAVAMAFGAAVLLAPAEETEAGYVNVTYKDVDGSNDTQNNVFELASAADFDGTGPNYVLNETYTTSLGWFIVTSDIDLVAINSNSTIQIVGDVNLIIGANCTLKVFKIYLAPNASLCLWTEDPGSGDIGKVVGTYYAVIDLPDGGYVTNTAHIEGGGGFSNGIEAFGYTEVINGATGIIEGFSGIIIDGDGIVTNYGSIASVSTSYGYGVVIGDYGEVYNYGEIIGKGYGSGVELISGGLVINYSSGKIEGGFGINSGGTNTIVNYGLIKGTYQGIMSGAHTTVTNYAGNGTTTGLIIGGINGVSIACGYVENHGKIEGTGTTGTGDKCGVSIYGTYIDSYSSARSGTIDNRAGDGINTGVITGYGNGVNIAYLDGTSGDKILNAGLIEGYAGNSIHIVDGADISITNYGTVKGDTVNAIQIDKDQGTTGATVTNHGIIETDGTQGVTFGNNARGYVVNGSTGSIKGGATSSSVVFGTNGNLENYGKISGGNTGVRAVYDDVVITNFAGDGMTTGLITGASYGVDIINGYVINHGTIEATNSGASAIRISGNALVFENNGTVKGNVELSNSMNVVVFHAGSTITGNFTMGTSGSSTLGFESTPSGLKYATVGGIANIGMATVSFKDLPPGYTGGTIVLIDAGAGSLTGAPYNSTHTTAAPDDVFTFRLLAKSKSLVAAPVLLNVPYTDEDGNTQSHDAINIDQAYFGAAGASGLLDQTGMTGTNGEWYYVTGNISLSDLSIAGDVNIIIKDGCTLSLTGAASDPAHSVNVASGCTLGIYSQPAANTGAVTSVTDCIVLNSGSSLINTATINAASLSGVYTAGGGIIINGVTGTIESPFVGIYFGGSSTVINKGDGTDSGLIKAKTGVYVPYLVGVSDGDYIFNDGKIEAVGADGVAIDVSNGVEILIVNREYGIIVSLYIGIHVGNGNGILIENWGEIEAGFCIHVSDGNNVEILNVGTITATETGVDLNTPGLIINTGIITSIGSYGIYLDEGGSVENYGEISCADYGIYSEGDLCVLNDGDGINDGIIEGTNGCGINAEGAAYIDNTGGLITGLRGIAVGWLDEASGWEIINSGIIVGVSVGIYVDDGDSIVITNSGTIEGWGYDGIWTYGISVKIINSGVINGEYAIDSWCDYTEVINYNKIEGIWCGIWTDSDATILNEDTIITGIGVGGKAIFTNKGTVTAGVYLSDDANEVTLYSGSSIIGDFVIGTNTGSKLIFAGTLDPSLTYAEITGDTDIGNKTAKVSFDVAGAGLPASFTIGDKIILIDGSAGSIVTAPANATFADGGKNFKIYVENHVLYAEMYLPYRDYYIKATADANTTISPAGTVTVVGGSNAKFTFSAVAGSFIGSVIVDGVYLSQADIDKGYYTFYDVRANHTIQVESRGAKTGILLTVTVAEGKGYAEYSVNGGNFAKYTSSVPIPEGSNVTLRAVAANGYEFAEWREGGIITHSAEVNFSNVTSNVEVSVSFFGEDSSGILSNNMLLYAIIVIAILLVVVVLVFLLKKPKVA